MLFTLWYHKKSRRIIYQGIFLFLLLWGLFSLWHVLQHNLDERGIEIGFSFLKDTAGFNIIQALIPYNEQSTYLEVFIVGLLNTLLVSALGIILATILGFLIGIARISPVFILRAIGTMFVETVRNIPLLLQLFIWYFVVLRAAPYPQQSITLWDKIFITNRGIYLAKPELTSKGVTLLLLCIGLIFLGLILSACDKNTCLKKGQSKNVFLILSVIDSIIILFILLALFSHISWSLPTLNRFNYEGGITLLPEFLALLLALSIYTAAYIAEIVRMGILSVSKGQWEAAFSLGLSKYQTLRYIILPQSLRVILPPLTNQYLNLTKNSSLATAIAYPDLVSIFAGTALNQTGQALEIIAMTMGVYLFISLVISGFMIGYERYTQWGNR